MSLAFHYRRSTLSMFWKSLPLLTALVLGWSLGFRPSAVKAAEAAADKAADDTEAKEPKPPEDIDLTTDDGLELKATYFPGMKGKESIPVIILHGLDATSNRVEFTQPGGLAEFLQTQLGCTVVVPDLRGHGESIKTSNQKLSHFKDKKLQEMLRLQHAAMIEQDLRAIKDWLWKKNNKGDLNIDKLVVIGVDSGAAVALSYADDDSKGYENHAAQYGPLKLGRFVKAMILISPELAKVTGLNSVQALSNPVIAKEIQTMILAGAQSKCFAEAKAFRNRLVNARPQPASGAKPEDITVWFYSKIDTKLQGTKMLGDPSLAIPDKIKSFMTARLVKNPDAKEWVWKERKLPHE